MNEVVSDRFWRRVASGLPDQCWEWTAGRFQFGHGAITVGGRLRKAHRVAWELVHGPIPDGMWVLHRCDNPPCCNPAHLYIGDVRDNVRDRDDRGRLSHGERHPAAKLSESQVRTIRDRRASGETLRSIADDFGVSVSLVHQVATRRKWRRVA